MLPGILGHMKRYITLLSFWNSGGHTFILSFLSPVCLLTFGGSIFFFFLAETRCFTGMPHLQFTASNYNTVHFTINFLPKTRKEKDTISFISTLQIKHIMKSQVFRKEKVSLVPRQDLKEKYLHDLKALISPWVFLYFYFTSLFSSSSLSPQFMWGWRFAVSVSPRLPCRWRLEPVGSLDRVLTSLRSWSQVQETSVW